VANVVNASVAGMVIGLPILAGLWIWMWKNVAVGVQWDIQDLLQQAMGRCKHCGKRVRVCRDWLGVPSILVHNDTGQCYGSPNDHKAEHA
jgi:hypothetical protein